MHTFKIPGLILSVSGIIFCILPWAETLIFDQSNMLLGLQFTEGAFSMICFILILGFSLLQTKTDTCKKGYFTAVLSVSALIAAISFYKIYLINLQTSKMLAFNIDVNAFIKYHPAYGLYGTAAVSTGIALVILFQLILLQKPVVVAAASLLEPKKAGRFYIPAHQNTSL